MKLPLFLTLPALLLAACSSAAAPTATSPPSLRATPSVTAPAASPPATVQAASACHPPAAPTAAETEGPYFKAGSPQRSSLLEAGMPGTKLVLSGQVLATDCTPIAGAVLEFWQADAQGAYDNAGYRLRGHQVADAQGRYQLTTIVPGLYPGRTRHIHFKAIPPTGRPLTSQLYFPNEPQNTSDAIFDRSLLLPIATAADGSQSATFNIILKAA